MACKLNLQMFPHDVQTCTVMLESCKYKLRGKVATKNEKSKLSLCPIDRSIIWVHFLLETGSVINDLYVKAAPSKDTVSIREIFQIV